MCVQEFVGMSSGTPAISSAVAPFASMVTQPASFVSVSTRPGTTGSYPPARGEGLIQKPTAQPVASPPSVSPLVRAAEFEEDRYRACPVDARDSPAEPSCDARTIEWVSSGSGHIAR